VQGQAAADEIIAGIEYFNTRSDIDTLIIGRGGGSIEDLWCFNEEKVANAIFNSKLPIISAVGHETDFTISDFVADLRAPTPSAAAELAVPSAAEIRKNLGKLYKQSLLALRANIARKRDLVERFVVKSPADVINFYRLKLDGLIEKSISIITIFLAKAKADLANRADKIDSLSPLKVLSRGYNFAQKRDGSVIRKSKDAKIGEEIILTFADGKVGTEIKEVLVNE
jgi:exodeoxyribonuclease VII large subunit